MAFLWGIALVAGDLEKDFQTPPDSAKPSGWWFWFYNLMDKEGITRDLTEFKDKGMGSAQIICAGNDYGAGAMPSGPVFLSPEQKSGKVVKLEITSTVGGKLRVLNPWTGKIIEQDTTPNETINVRP